VVADTPKTARDAAELILVDYDVQPAITDLSRAMDEGAPLVWPEAKHNIVFDWEIGDKAKTDALFAQAAHVTRPTVPTTASSCPRKRARRRQSTSAW
jgi:carbon-monoxide dehydrogenase large subunit